MPAGNDDATDRSANTGLDENVTSTDADEVAASGSDQAVEPNRSGVTATEQDGNHPRDLAGAAESARIGDATGRSAGTGLDENVRSTDVGEVAMSRSAQAAEPNRSDVTATEQDTNRPHEVAGAAESAGDLDAARNDAEEDAGQGGDPPRHRTTLPALIAACLLLTGFAVGVIARIPLQHNGDAAPNAVDVGFCQDMSVHHAQAVQMAALELSGGSDTAVKRLAYDILTTQQNQAGRMQGWLQLWERPSVDPDGYMGWMTDHATMHGSMSMHSMPTGPAQSMPGMATAAEINQLRQLTGPAQDTLFLQLMLRHHQGGIAMVTYASTHADTDAVRTLAASMNTTQQGEITLMTQLLAARDATPLPTT